MKKQTSRNSNLFTRPSRFRRRLLYLVIVLAGLSAFILFAAPAILTALIGQETLKHQVAQTLEAVTGRRVEVSGSVKMTFLPAPGFMAGPLRIANPKGFDDTPMLDVDKAAIHVQLLPLLSRDIIPSIVYLHKVTLRLIKDKQGHSNWSSLPFLPSFLNDALPPDDETSTEKKDDTSVENAPIQHARAGGTPTLSATHQSDIRPPEALGSQWNVIPRFQGIRMLDTTVIWIDHKNGLSATMDRLDLSTGQGDTFNFSLSFDITPKKTDVYATVHANGTAQYLPDINEWRIDAGEFTFGVLSGPRPQKTSAFTSGQNRKTSPVVTLGTRFTLNTSSGTIELNNLHAKGLGGEALGHIVGKNILVDPSFQGALTVTSPLTLDGLIRAGLVTAPPSPSTAPQNSETLTSAKPILAKTEIAFEAGPRRFEIKKLNIDAKEAGSLSAAVFFHADATPQLKFDVDIRDLDLDLLSPLFPASSKSSFSLPTSLDLCGSIRARNIETHNRIFDNLFTTIQATHGAYRLYPFSISSGQHAWNADLKLKEEDGGAFLDAKTELFFTDTRDSESKVRISKLGFAGQVLPDHIQGNLDAPQIYPADLASFFDPAHADKNIASPISASSTIRIDLNTAAKPIAQRVALDKLNLHYGQIDVGGSARFENSQPPRLKVKMNMQTLDLNQFQTSHAPAAALPTNIIVEGQMHIKTLKGLGTPVNDVTLEGTLQDTDIDIRTLTAKALGGSISGQTHLAGMLGTVSAQTASSLSLAFDNIKLHEQSQLNWPIRGAMDMSLNAQFTGTKRNEIFSSLQGTLQASIPHAVINTAPQAPGLKLDQNTIKVSFAGEAPNQKDVVGINIKSSAQFSSQGLFSNGSGQIAGRIELDDKNALLHITTSEARGVFRMQPPFARQQSPMPVSWRMGLHYDQQQSQLSIQKFMIQTTGLVGRGNFSINLKAKNNFLSGEFEIEPFSPRKALPSLGLPININATPDVLNTASAKIFLTADTHGLTISKLSLKLDTTTAKGSFAINDFSKIVPILDLDVDTIDIDQYLPPEPFPTEETAPQLPDDTPFDTTFLRKLAFKTKIRIGYLKKGNMTWKKSRLSVACNAGQIKISHQADFFYDGTYSVQVNLKAGPQTIRADVNLALDGVEAPSLLADFADGHAVTKGTGYFVLSAHGQGNSARSLRQDLSGDARFRLTNGILSIRASSGKDKDSTEKREEVKFDVFSSTFAAQKGLATTDNFLIKGPTIEALGKGTLNLVNEEIALGLKVSLDGSPQIPADILGTLSFPSLKVDTSRMIGVTVFRLLKGFFSLPANTVKGVFKLFSPGRMPPAGQETLNK